MLQPLSPGLYNIVCYCVHEGRKKNMKTEMYNTIHTHTESREKLLVFFNNLAKEKKMYAV